VGPQQYIRTCDGSIGANVSIRWVAVLKSRIRAIHVPCAEKFSALASMQRKSRRSELPLLNAMALLVTLLLSFIQGAALAHSHLKKSVPASPRAPVVGNCQVRLDEDYRAGVAQQPYEPRHAIGCASSSVA
jgi:hypothetical protein